MPDNLRHTAESVLAIIKSMDPAERARLFKAMHDFKFESEVGFAVFPLRIVAEIVEASRKDMVIRNRLVSELRKYGNELYRRTRKPNETRLERGKLVMPDGWVRPMGSPASATTIARMTEKAARNL